MQLPVPDILTLPTNLSAFDGFLADDHLVLPTGEDSTVVVALDRWPLAPIHLPHERILAAARLDKDCWATSSLLFADSKEPAPPAVTHHESYTVTRYEIFKAPTVRGLFIHRPELGKRSTVVQTDARELTRVGSRVMVFGDRVGERPFYLGVEGLVPVEGLPAAIDHTSKGAATRLGDGSLILFIGGDAYEVGEDGHVGARWPIGAVPSSHKIPTLAPWEDDGFYYVSGGVLHRVRRGQAPAQVLEQLEDVTTVAPGPGGSLLLGRRRRGKAGAVQLASLGFPDTAEHIPLTRADLALDTYATVTEPAAYCSAGEHLVIPVTAYAGPITKRGPTPDHEGRLVLVPVEPLLARRRVKAGLATQANTSSPLAKLAVLVKKTGTEAEIRALARLANDPGVYDFLLDGTVAEKVRVWKRKRVMGEDGQPTFTSLMVDAVEIVAGRRLGAKKGRQLIRSQLARDLIADAPLESQRASALKASVENLVVRGTHKVNFKVVEQRSIDCTSLAHFPKLACVYFDQLLYRNGLSNSDALRSLAAEICVDEKHIATVDELVVIARLS